MTTPVPLSIVYSDGRHIGLAMPGETSAGRQSETPLLAVESQPPNHLLGRGYR
ncbi:unnamed protein product [Prunus armeniaca]